PAPAARVRRNSVVRNHAVGAGRLVARTELARLLRRRKRPNQGPVEDPLAAQIRAANDRLQTAKLVREFCLQAAEGGLRFGLALLRGELHHETTRLALRRLGRSPSGGRRRRRRARAGCRRRGWFTRLRLERDRAAVARPLR